MLLYVISVKADVPNVRASGQRNMIAMPAEPAPVIATDPVVSDLNVYAIQAATIFDVGITANADAGTIYAAPIFATQPVVANLTAYSLSQ